MARDDIQGSRYAEPDPSFLPQAPPPWAVRGLATLLIVLAAGTLLATIVIRVPETVTSTFVLAPVHGTDPVRASRDGFVVRIDARGGQPVARDETLFVLRSESVSDRSSDLSALETERAGASERLTLLSREYVSRRRADEEEVGRLEEQGEHLASVIELQRAQLALLQDVLRRYRSLYEQQLVSRTKVASYELEANRSEVELARRTTERAEALRSLQKLRHQMEARDAEHRARLRALRDQVESADVRIAALREDLARSAGAEVSLPAPCAGTVLRLHVQAVGSFVQEGESLAELACEDQSLQAELTVPHANVALLEPGQGVKLLYDAFPYQLHGVRFGTLRWVSPATVEVDGRRAFRAFADVDDEAIVVKGKPRHLRAGMSGEAKIVVGRRRLAAWAFEPLRRLRESLREAPAHPSSR